ncbi:hypothetical protein IWQ57_003789 [Coemansia nantahalensis]|uniref:Uncharacterized protein n=1 Tax=Coemansia nantahalensis TaxID=2789366 RepID=A0ACC1JUZ3_9FUNG|nr:hypothetical protein IWQ57_003789 [Coemansia nantahalensis]
MSAATQSLLRKPAVAGAGALAQRVLAPRTTRTAADVRRDRASLAAVVELQSRPECRALDVAALLRKVPSAPNHHGYEALSKVAPLVYGWSGPGSGWGSQLVLAKVPPERRPSADFEVPLLTAIDYINEDLSGHPGVIHGGVTAIIAHTMLALAAVPNVPRGASLAVQSLNMDYRRPVFVGTFVKIHAWPYQRSPGAIQVAAHVCSLEDEVLVEANAGLAAAAA